MVVCVNEIGTASILSVTVAERYRNWCVGYGDILVSTVNVVLSVNVNGRDKLG